ncbi:Subtilase family protein [Paracoccus isoporae]|uniref:Subtilase family protein n=1 Tax=Paracoccus isoporae TaxID=591205 RepID=A0A1G7GUR4_9RHOB|nr:S8 family peptidase [Paracoccus isoporae]SDE91928.1 Subtilase family protein [Paracoccus isoporae]
MPRNLRHFHLRDLGASKPYQWKGTPVSKRPSDVPDREAHAQILLRALDALPDIKSDGLPGLYLEVSGRAGEKLKRTSLDTKHLNLLKYEEGKYREDGLDKATIFATEKGVEAFRKKVAQFQTENTPDREKNGQLIPGRPKNADLVQSLAAITEAGLRALWRSPSHKFPAAGVDVLWEIWLNPDEVDRFIQVAPEYGLEPGSELLRFPEDVVIVANGTQDALATAVRKIGGVRALAAPTVTADFFEGLPVKEQAAWVDELAQRTSYPPNADPGFITLLDTGVSRAHPLIQPSLSSDDRHAADPSWAVEDIKGHGTQMAGLALFGDLTTKLQQMEPVEIHHRLESVKLLPDAGENPHHLLGAVTRDAIDAVEARWLRRRIFSMPATTSEDTPHDGAPTSWSSAIDELAAGVLGQQKVRRLLLISAGNTDNFTFGAGNYLDRCDHPDNEVEAPAQAWNALCVGAYTEKTALPAGEGTAALAPFGDLSPASRTASWSSYWPLKPDVVLEGGNWATGNSPPPMRHGWLSLLSTDHRYPQRSFCFTFDTSAATALAANQISTLWSEYPMLWPETVRGLYVSSARWTSQMRSHLPASANPQKGSFALLFRRYGYGVPDLDRARRSASNALTLIVEDTINPYALSDKTGNDIHHELKLFTLPWPVEELRRLGNANVTLRVTLSTFIAPNPSEPSRGNRYRYASHNLRFKLNRADESEAQFLARISKAAEQTDEPESDEQDGWDFGSNRRDVGSLHIDQLTCKASDLARRNLIAVHPVTGWWKAKSRLQDALPTVRYSLVVEIDAEKLECELHAEVAAVIQTLTAVGTVIAV